MKNVKNTWGNIEIHQKIIKMGSKVAPISILGRPRGPPVMDLVFGHPFLMIFGDFGVPFWLPFGSGFGVIFRHFFGSALGATSGRLRPDLVPILADFWLDFKTVLGTPEKSEN